MNMKKKGFTTVELIAVVAAVVVLAAILIPSFVVLNKRIKEQAAMQEQINQQLGEIVDKVENQDYMSKAEFEAKLAEELAKINAQLKADAENKAALIAEIQAKVDAAVEALNSMEKGLTKEEVEAIIAKALEGQLTVEQVKAIVQEALKDVVSEEDIKKIVDEAVEALRKEIGESQITTEQMEKAINEAIEKALEGTKKDIETIKAQIAEIIAKLNNGLTKEEVEKIIEEALKKFEEGQKPSVTPEEMQAAIDAAVERALAQQAKDIEALRAELQAIAEKLNGSLTKEEVEKIINDALEAFKESLGQGGTDQPDQPEQPEEPELPEIETKHYMCWNNYMYNIQGNHKYPNCTYEADLTEMQVKLLGGKCPRCGESIYEIDNPNYVPEEEVPVHYICWNNYMHNVQGNNKYPNCDFEADLTQSQLDLLGKWGNTDHPKCPRCGEMLNKYDNPDFVPEEEEAVNYICWNNYMGNVQGNDKYPYCDFEAELTKSQLDFFGKWGNTDHPMCPVCGEMLFKYTAPTEEETKEEQVADLEELKEALNDEKVNYIVLNEDIVLDEVFVINRDLTIDLNGKELTSVTSVIYPAASTLTVDKDFELTIKNGQIEDVAAKVDGGIDFIRVSKGASLNLENVELTISVSPEVKWNNTMDRWQSNSAEHHIITIGSDASVVFKDTNVVINVPEVVNFSSYTRNPFTVVAVYFARNSQNAEFVLDGGSFEIKVTDPNASSKNDTIYFVKSDRRTDVAANATNKVEVKGDAVVTIGGLNSAGKLNSNNRLFYLGDGYNKGYTYYSGIKSYILSSEATFNIDGIAYSLNFEGAKAWDLEAICQEFGLRSVDKAFYATTEIVYGFACTDCEHEAEFTLAELQEYVQYWGTKKVNGVVLPKCDHCTYGGLELK